MRPIFILLGLLAALPAAAQKVDKKALLAQLDDPSATKRQVAYASFEEGPGKRYKSSALTALDKLHKRDLGRYQSAVKAITDLLPIDTDRRRKLWDKRLKKWYDKRPKAIYAVMDETAYPNPGPTNVMRGPWKGARHVTTTLRSARKAFQPFDETIGKAMDALGDAAALEKRIRSLEAAKALVDERAEVLVRNKRRPKKVTPYDATFLGLLLLLKQDKYADANKQLAALKDVEKAWYFVAYSYRIKEVNKTIELPPSCTADCKWALGEIDRIRMACGILPMEHSPILTKAVAGHLDWCRRSNIFSHYTRDPKTRTPNDRCKLQGWKGRASENLADCDGPKNAITVWMWDGAHARNMLARKWHFIGFADNGWTGMNIGYGVPTRVPREVFYSIPRTAPK